MVNESSKRLTVGRLAAKYGLSRSTLLYYDSIGLLSPMAHAKGEYRAYGPDEEKRLAQICHYRKAGIPLKEVKAILDSPTSSISAVLEARLKELNEEITILQEQRGFITGVLMNAPPVKAGGLDKAAWVEVLRSSGFNEQDMENWHQAFERTHPDKHQMFLEYLQIPAEEISLIRQWSAGPQRIQKIQQASSRYMELFYEFFSSLDRLGPGSPDSTRKALSCIAGLPAEARVLDVGCGTGPQSIALCDGTDFLVTAVDNWQTALDKLAANAVHHSCSKRINIINADMNELDFPTESFDLIWSEGAVYLMGFEHGINRWKRFLKQGGSIALTELSWTADERPDEAVKFWQEGYPQMKSIQENIEILRRQGFEIIKTFPLPESDWWDVFYAQLEKSTPAFLDKYKESTEARTIVESNEREMALMKKYHHIHNYVFYIARKN